MGANVDENGILRAEEAVETYFMISPYMFQDQDEINLAIYYRFNNNYILFRRAGARWSTVDYQRLVDLGIQEFYTQSSESEWQSLIENRMTRMLTNVSTPSTEKAKIIYSVATSATDSFFKDPSSPEAARKSVAFVKHSVEYLTSSKDSFWDLFESANSSLQEQTHGIHCAAYSVRLAQHMGLHAPDKLLALGIGAVLHDIGKTKVDKAILDKAGPLTDEEWVEIKKHPQYGIEIIQKFGGIVPSLAKEVILEHHERPDGSGYPKGKSGSELSIFSNIVAIADVFDSMTSHRAYKRQSTSMETMLELLQTQMGRLDKALLVAFIEMMRKR